MRRAVNGKGLRTKQGDTRAPAVRMLAAKRPRVAAGEPATVIRYQIKNGG